MLSPWLQLHSKVADKLSTQGGGIGLKASEPPPIS